MGTLRRFHRGYWNIEVIKLDNISPYSSRKKLDIEISYFLENTIISQNYYKFLLRVKMLLISTVDLLSILQLVIENLAITRYINYGI